MADLRNSEQTGSWLESELARQFAPVSAPDTLWAQIHEQRRPLRVQPSPWATWSIAAAATLMLLAGLAWRLGAKRDPADNLEALVGQELRSTANGSGKLDFRSADAGEIQSWLKAKSDIDVRLANQPLQISETPGNEKVRLLGARVIRLEKFSAAVITYRVGDNFASMLITDRHAGGIAGPGHNSLRTRSNGNMLLYSWNQGPNDYAMAFTAAAQPHQPCLLCHAGSPALMVLR